MNFSTIDQLKFFKLDIKEINGINISYESVFSCSAGGDYIDHFKNDIHTSLHFLANEINEIKDYIKKRREVKCHHCCNSVAIPNLRYILFKSDEIAKKVANYDQMLDELDEIFKYFKRCQFRFELWEFLGDYEKVNEVEDYIKLKVGMRFIYYMGASIYHYN
jgi:hypothetical protein